MAKRKMTYGQTTIYKTLHRKQISKDVLSLLIQIRRVRRLLSTPFSNNLISVHYACLYTSILLGPSSPWSYGSCIYIYLWNQCLSPLMLKVRIPLRRGLLDTTLCDKVCQWLATGRWFLRVFWSPPPIKSGVKYHNPPSIRLVVLYIYNYILLYLYFCLCFFPRYI